MARSQPIAVPGAERGSELEPFSAPPLRAAGCQAFDEIDFSGSRIAFLATKKRQTFPAREYLCDFSSACEVAVRGAGPVVHDLRLDGAVLRLRFAGPALVPFVLPPLAHLRSDAAGEQPVLTVDFWDAASTGVYPPPYPLGGEDVPGRGAVRAYDNAGVRAVFHSGVDPRDGHFTSITVYDEEVPPLDISCSAPITSKNPTAPRRCARCSIGCSTGQIVYSYMPARSELTDAQCSSPALEDRESRPAPWRLSSPAMTTSVTTTCSSI
jgi:hypothetical protein